MDMTMLNKLLDNKETRELLLKLTELQLEYIKNYKSLDQRCSFECEHCDDCEELEDEWEDESEEENCLSYNKSYVNTNNIIVMEGLQELCDEYNLKITYFSESKNDSGVSYSINLKSI